MNFYKIIVLTAASGIFVCGHNITVSVGNFNLEQFIGVWFDVGRILIHPEHQNILKCNWFNVTVQNEKDQSFNEVYEFELNGHTKQVTAHGKIDNSKLHIIFPAVTDDESIYDIMSYENGEELIFRDRNVPTYYGMVSRRPTFSSKTKAEFEGMAILVGANAVYLEHNNCSYDYQFSV